MWQADTDFIDPKQQQIDLTTYFKKFKPTKKVVEELNQTSKKHAFVDILYKE